LNKSWLTYRCGGSIGIADFYINAPNSQFHLV